MHISDLAMRDTLEISFRPTQVTLLRLVPVFSSSVTSKMLLTLAVSMQK